MAVNYQVWLANEQKNLVRSFMSQLTSWSQEDLHHFGDHSLELVKECCVQMRALVECFPDIMALRRVEIFCYTIRGYISSGCPPDFPELPLAVVQENEWMCRGSAGCDRGGIIKQGFRAAIEEESHTKGRLDYFSKDLRKARDLIEQHEGLWLCNGYLSEAMTACQVLFDDAMCSALGLLHEPDGPWNVDTN